MSSPNEPSRILTAEARTILAPMGLKQKSRSRVWLDDHGWWVGVVEFQPSSWSKGAYLNVACWLLWHVKSFISFDLGGRIEEHVQFENEQQFRPRATQLATLAADEIRRWRNTIPSVCLAAEYLESKDFRQAIWQKNLWPDFNTAIANGLCGNQERADRYFKQIGDPREADSELVRTAKLDAAQLHKIVRNKTAFRAEIAKRVHQCRALHKLPPLDNLSFDAPQTF